MSSHLLSMQVADILDRLRCLRGQTRGPLAIGIGGGECSGKSYLSHNLLSMSASQGLTFHIIPLDGYLRYSRAQRRAVAKQKCGIEAKAYEIGDHPGCFDLQQARADIIGLLETGLLNRVRRYDYSLGQVAVENITKRVGLDAIVIVEGIFALHETLIDVYSFTCFVEADTHTLLERYLQRHVAREETDEEGIKQRFRDAVVPCYKAFIEPTRERVSVLIDTSSSRSSD